MESELPSSRKKLFRKLKTLELLELSKRRSLTLEEWKSLPLGQDPLIGIAENFLDGTQN